MINKKLLHEFVEDWTGKGYEKGQAQSFWRDLLTAFGVEKPSQFIDYELPVQTGHTCFMDGYIKSTSVLVEQKSIDINLGKGYKQSDGVFRTAFEQARNYAAFLPHNMNPRWIITCNFKEFWVYDMNYPNMEPNKILLENLEKDYYMLELIVKTTDEQTQREKDLSMKTGEVVSAIYDRLIDQYDDPESHETQRNINKICVRLVFLLYAEDAQIFGDKNEFHDYLKDVPATKWRSALIELFKVLNTPIDQRDKYLDEDLKRFPYVNGGLFAEEIQLPQFTEELKDLILNKASANFDWSSISPSIFGSVFESTINPTERRKGGMHYTATANIHKVIDPLFLNQLNHEFDACKTTKEYIAFQDKLASLTFFDPACGSGNFLTETYISLRRLENKIVQKIFKEQPLMGDLYNPIKVDIHQFYGLEINDFAVSVATTALWIAELQMRRETEKLIQLTGDALPLKNYENIHEGNALCTDWTEIIAPANLNYIIGNPPFIGAREKDANQAADLINLFGKKWPNIGNLDYVGGWYLKTAQMMQQNNQIKAALVSTNSITQGEQVAIIWTPLFEQYGVHIDFAYRTFRWDNESSEKAHVHCVIVGFSSCENKTPRRLYRSDGTYQPCENINGYLMMGPNIAISNKSASLCDVPAMVFGSMPNDGGFLSNYSDEEKNAIVQKYPESEPYFHKLLGAEEFINNKIRWCIWLDGVSPMIIKQIPPIYEAVQAVRNMRMQSKRVATQKLADFPYLFGEIRQPKTHYLLIPSTSSENRKYIPIGFISPNIISNNANLLIPSATLYHFGILTSNVHMSWMRAVCGRLKSDYRYSANVVYNNFPWPSPTKEQKKKIEQTAQAILDARTHYPECSLADLYDDAVMPAELVTAHQENNRAVMAAYGFDTKMTESECVAKLLEMYQELTR